MGKYLHGMSGTRVHNTWLRMHDRCKNDRDGNYGKRGITICTRWNSFVSFFEDMGDPPTSEHSIDRVDVDGNYEPGNCRWATRIEQARNTRRNTFVEYSGETKTLAEWAEIYGIKQPTLCQRIYTYGWPIAKAITEPVAPKLPKPEPWLDVGMSRSSWYRAGRPGI